MDAKHWPVMYSDLVIQLHIVAIRNAFVYSIIATVQLKLIIYFFVSIIILQNLVEKKLFCLWFPSLFEYLFAFYNKKNDTQICNTKCRQWKQFLKRKYRHFYLLTNKVASKKYYEIPLLSFCNSHFLSISRVL